MTYTALEITVVTLTIFQLTFAWNKPQNSWMKMEKYQEDFSTNSVTLNDGNNVYSESSWKQSSYSTGDDSKTDSMVSAQLPSWNNQNRDFTDSVPSKFEKSGDSKATKWKYGFNPNTWENQQWFHHEHHPPSPPIHHHWQPKQAEYDHLKPFNFPKQPEYDHSKHFSFPKQPAYDHSKHFNFPKQLEYDHSKHFNFPINPFEGFIWNWRRNVLSKNTHPSLMQIPSPMFGRGFDLNNDFPNMFRNVDIPRYNQPSYGHLGEHNRHAIPHQHSYGHYDPGFTLNDPPLNVAALSNPHPPSQQTSLPHPPKPRWWQDKGANLFKVVHSGLDVYTWKDGKRVLFPQSSDLKDSEKWISSPAIKKKSVYQKNSYGDKNWLTLKTEFLKNSITHT